MQLHFEKQEKRTLRSDTITSIVEPSQYPSFVLSFNYDWNDYGTHSWFSLIYCEAAGKENRTLIGELKILHDDEDYSYDVLPDSFEKLDDSFYSLGIETDYYETMRGKFSEQECKDILHALRDCAMYQQFNEAHKEDGNYASSLKRELSSERALREGKSIILKRNMGDFYKIGYRFFADYNKDVPDAYAEARINFNYNPKPFYRCACIIGENGSGKTSFVRKFISDYVNNDDTCFLQRPNFSSLLLAYSTQFDGYDGLDDNEGALTFHKICTDQSKEYTIAFMKEAMPEIHKRLLQKRKPMFPVYLRAIESNVGKNENIAFRETYDILKEKGGDRRFVVNEKKLNEFIEKLSSGQLQLLLLLSFLYRYMNYDTLIFFDEPEIHLHPQAIDRFFKMLSQFLIMFQSYCIVVTHSPIVVREVMGRKVFVLTRDENNIPKIAPCGIETFGEDISYLYERLYHYKDNMSNFRDMVKMVIKRQNTTNEEEIIKYIAPNTALSLNSRYIIHTICEEEENVQD